MGWPIDLINGGGRIINSPAAQLREQAALMNLSTEKFLCRMLLWLYGPAYVAAACYASYEATFVRNLFGAGSPQVLFSSVYRQFALLTESFSMVAVLALMVAGLFLCSQYFLILRNREPVHSRCALWFVT